MYTKGKRVEVGGVLEREDGSPGPIAVVEAEGQEAGEALSSVVVACALGGLLAFEGLVRGAPGQYKFRGESTCRVEAAELRLPPVASVSGTDLDLQPKDGKPPKPVVLLVDADAQWWVVGLRHDGQTCSQGVRLPRAVPFAQTLAGRGLTSSRFAPLLCRAAGDASKKQPSKMTASLVLQEACERVEVAAWIDAAQQQAVVEAAARASSAEDRAVLCTRVEVKAGGDEEWGC